MKQFHIAGGLFRLLAIFSVGVFLVNSVIPARADEGGPQDPSKGVAYDQHLDAQVPLDASFVDETGTAVTLGSYFKIGRPVVLDFVYYNCPNICSLVLTNVVNSLKNQSFTAGSQYDLVVVSIDPTETPAMAAEAKAKFSAQYGKPGTEQGWHFLTGPQASIDAFTQAVGYTYRYDDVQKEYAHPTGIVMLTPEGKVSRYLLGIEFSDRDMRLGLVEASAGRIGTPVDQFFLLCYHYDPVTGRYSLLINRILQITGVLSVIILGMTVLLLLRRERSAQKTAAQV